MNNCYPSRAREASSAPKSKPSRATRKCLACMRQFTSWHAGNRICDACKSGDEGDWGSASLCEDFALGRPDPSLE